MKKVIRLTENDLMRIVKRVISEESNTKVSPDELAKFIKMMELFPKWRYDPINEFALKPNQIGFSGFKNNEFIKFIGKPLSYSFDGFTNCYVDLRGDFILKHLGKKTTLPLNDITNIKNSISKIQ